MNCIKDVEGFILEFFVLEQKTTSEMHVALRIFSMAEVVV